MHLFIYSFVRFSFAFTPRDGILSISLFARLLQLPDSLLGLHDTRFRQRATTVYGSSLLFLLVAAALAGSVFADMISEQAANYSSLSWGYEIYGEYALTEPLPKDAHAYISAPGPPFPRSFSCIGHRRACVFLGRDCQHAEPVHASRYPQVCSTCICVRRCIHAPVAEHVAHRALRFSFQCPTATVERSTSRTDIYNHTWRPSR